MPPIKKATKTRKLAPVSLAQRVRQLEDELDDIDANLEDLTSLCKASKPPTADLPSLADAELRMMVFSRLLDGLSMAEDKVTSAALADIIRLAGDVEFPAPLLQAMTLLCEQGTGTDISLSDGN